MVVELAHRITPGWSAVPVSKNVTTPSIGSFDAVILLVIVTGAVNVTAPATPAPAKVYLSLKNTVLPIWIYLE